jgi:Uma2 family endonuclease
LACVGPWSLALSPAVIIEERLKIPAGIDGLDAFRTWTLSEAFPEGGRIDFVAGDVEVDLGPEDLHSHGTVKAAIASSLQHLVSEEDLGELFIDRTRVSCPEADLSCEPDVVGVLWEDLERGRCRYLPAVVARPGRFVEIEGAPSLIVEIVSKSSERKDTERLPRLYARAGVREFWLVDARGEEIVFRVHVLAAGGYRPAGIDAEGWALSAVLGCPVRLTRERTRHQTWRYYLEARSLDLG